MTNTQEELEKIALSLKFIRLMLGINQYDLAKMALVGPATISIFEKYQRIPDRSLNMVLTILRKDRSQMIELANEVEKTWQNFNLGEIWTIPKNKPTNASASGGS